jgi:two-component system, cell cycle response regulator
MATRILVVDDSDVIRAMVAHAFKPFDCDVLEASDGSQGLAAAARTKPDLILLDISMPVMDGFEVLHRLKANRDLRSVPVIMLTAEAAKDTVLRIAKMGVHDYIVKPFDEDEITLHVERFVELKTRCGVVNSKKAYTDPLDILVVDNKPNIQQQIINGLAHTNWTVEGQALVPLAWGRILCKTPDVILVSCSLPGRGGFWLLETIQKQLSARRLPIFALSVKTAVDDHALAHRLGTAGVITKPLDFTDLEAKIVRALNLDISSKYFDLRPDVLLLNLPPDFASIAYDIAPNLEAKLAETVDAGLDKLVINLGQVRMLDLNFIRLCVSIHQYARELSMKMGVIASHEVRKACRQCAEARDWVYGDSLLEVLTALNRLPNRSPSVPKFTTHDRRS